jgi:hypothetical protein
MFAETYKEFKVGDLITAYHKGFWKLTKIQRRFYTARDIDYYRSCEGKKEGDEYNPLFFYEWVLNGKFNKPPRPREECCDVAFCKKVDDAYIVKKFEDLIREMETIQKVYHEITGESSSVDLSKLKVST